MTQQRTGLPTIVRFLGTTDAGEYGATLCPHCDAKGRYVTSFLCSDGTRRGAMAGCIKLFAVSPIAKEEKAITERRDEREKAGRKLASWDATKLDKIESYYAGNLTEAQCLAWIADENAKRSQWMERNGRRAYR